MQRQPKRFFRRLVLCRFMGQRIVRIEIFDDANRQ
jgi:hypothetical protein